MPLQGDQRALLQLLCERGQSYEDISGLLGVPPEEVRDRARGALTEIADADPDKDVALTDFLLGQADPIGRADAIRFLQGDPDSLERARTIQAELAEIAPGADQPKLPEARGKRRRAALPDSGDSTATPAAPVEGADRQTSRQTKLLAALAAVGLVLVVAILAIAGVFSGSDEDGTDDGTAATTTADGTTADSENITTVSLQPVAGSGVAGSAVFGLVSDQQLYVDVDVQGLDPDLPRSQSYLVWLMVGDTAGYPIDQLDPDDNGGFSGRLAVPTAIAVAVGNQAQSVRVSSTPVAQLQSRIEQATEQEVPVLTFVGTELASGDIPLVRDGGKGQQGNQGGG